MKACSAHWSARGRGTARIVAFACGAFVLGIATWAYAILAYSMVAVAFVMLMFLLVRYARYRYGYARILHFGPITTEMTFTEAGIRAQSTTVTTELLWEAYTEYAIGHEFLLLYRNPNDFHALPRSAFTGNDYDALLALVRSKLKSIG